MAPSLKLGASLKLISASKEMSAGDITTLLDLAPRERQDNDLFPLNTEKTWFSRDPERRTIPAVPFVADFNFRGPAAFGQRFTFDIGSVPCGDTLLGCAVQIRLNHWLDTTTQLYIQSGRYTYTDTEKAWFYSNSLGSSIIEKAELEIDGKTIEEIDGDFIYAFSCLFFDLNAQFGVATDHLGSVSIPSLLAWNPRRLFPTEDGVLHCILPFFFMRQRLREGLPMIAIKEGSVRIHVTLRPFHECVRQARGYRFSREATPFGETNIFKDTTFPFDTLVNVTAVKTDPGFKNLRLITYGSMIDGKVRDAMLNQPFEILHRQVQTFTFSEPMKYAIGKGSGDTVKIQLPLEANHPLEEIIWFIRRKDCADNNEWTNYSSVLERQYDAEYNPFDSLLVSATLQVNGITLCEAEGDYYRDLIARTHKGGYVSWSHFIYGYPFARHPGEHQPSGTLNASRVQNLRLTLEIKTSCEWEVKVFCIGLNWLRLQNGIANLLFKD